MSDAVLWLQRFADFAAIFQKRFMNPLWERYVCRETDPWDAVGLYLEGYAFERQGRRPDYGPAAADVCLQLRTQGIQFDSGSAQVVWEYFENLLGKDRLNEANNPLCPKGTRFSRKESSRTTNSASVIEFAAQLPERGKPSTLVTYLRSRLDQDQANEAHQELRTINGIGPKIASLFLRDLAIHYDSAISKDRHLLQPIDVWVRRMVKELDGPVTNPDKQNPRVDEEVGKWIVKKSAEFVCPEVVNQGMWYFAREIAGSYYRLRNSIKDLSYAKALFAQHEQALNKSAEAATSISHRI